MTHRERGGSALVLALLVVLILSMLLGSMAFEAKLEAGYVMYVRERTQASALSESGVEIAKLLLGRVGGQTRPGGVDDDSDRWHDAVSRLTAGQSIIGLVEPVGDGFVILDIEPEPARLNINLLSREDWERILVNAGIPEQYLDWIVDPILDWTDTDDTPNNKGAETDDYYGRLDPPYAAKNGPFDTIEELLMVKGFPPVLMDGGFFDPAMLQDDVGGVSGPTVTRFTETNIVVSGIKAMLTTYGDGKVNVQSAGYDALRSLPGIDDISARAIMEEREMLDDNGDPDPFESVDDLFTRIDDLDPAIRDRITVQSRYFRITSTGRVGNVERQLWCIAYLDGTQLRFLRWCEER